MRRAVLNQKNTLEAYANALQGNVKELDALYSDALINVTGFFRNPDGALVRTGQLREISRCAG